MDPKTPPIIKEKIKDNNPPDAPVRPRRKLSLRNIPKGYCSVCGRYTVLRKNKNLCFNLQCALSFDDDYSSP